MPRPLLTCLAFLLAATPALAQRAPSGWEQVDAGRADRGPLSTSARQVPIDLRLPLSFDRVYRVPGSTNGVRVPGAPAGEEVYARISGGLTAVFPRSDYVATKKGTAVLIPAGTIFYIGELPKPMPGSLNTQSSAAEPARPVGPTRTGLMRASLTAVGQTDLRVDSRATPPSARSQIAPQQNATPPAEPPPAPSPRPAQPMASRAQDVMSETHRRDRVRVLMQAAVRAG